MKISLSWLSDLIPLRVDAPTLAVHCVQADEADGDLLAEKQVAVAHCPKSNAKLGAGIAPVKMLREKGVTVGLGTDSVVSNNAGESAAAISSRASSSANTHPAARSRATRAIIPR